MQPVNNSLDPLTSEGCTLANPPLGDRGALVSDEVSEIISYRPHWMVRRGNMVFFGVLLLLLLLTVFIDYPDVIAGSARLVAINAPKPAVTHKDGRLTRLFVATGQRVTKGQHLATVESTADYTQVMQLYSWVTTAIDQVAGGNLEKLTLNVPPAFAALGDLQTAYGAAEREWAEQRQFFGSGYYPSKRMALLRDVQFAVQLKESIRRQEALTVRERALQQTELDAYDSLAKDRLVAPLELNKYKAGLLGKDQALVQTGAQLINNDAAAHNTRKALLDLQKAMMDQQQKLASSLLVLKSAIQAWMQQYVVTAPEDGTLAFVAPLQLNEQVAVGQELFFVQPASAMYYAQLMAGQSGLGKVKEGQAVRLKVASYPSEEFGYLKGTVQSVAAFPNRRDSFLVKVELSQGLKTVYGRELFFRNNLSATAEIITDDRKLIHRFFDPLKKLWTR